MYKVLIVDDEKIVRLAIKSMIRWDNGDLEFAGFVRNGMEALKLCKQSNPDIIITDLKMPVMDGIEMIKRLKADHFDGEILVLSNYNDFDLVREAMKYGAHDYILKVTVNSDGFMKVMAEIVDKLNKKNKNSGRGEKKHKDLSEERISRLKKIVESNDYVNQRDDENLFDLGAGSCLQTYAVFYENSESGADGDLMTSVLSNISSDLSRRVNFHISLKLDDSHSLLQLHYLKPDQAEDILDPQFAADRIKSLAKLYYNRTIGIVYCKSAFDFASLMHELDNCVSAMQLLFYQDYRNSNLSAQTEMTNDDAEIKNMMPQIAEKICSGIRETNKEALICSMRQLVDMARLSNLNPFILKKDIKKLLRCAEKKLIVDDAQGDSLFDIYPNDKDVIFEALTDDRLFTDISMIAESAIHRIKKDRHYRKEVSMSIDFIEQHIASRITVSQIAAHVNMTETYISKIFHSETGKSIIDYINYCKMKKAYQMLIEGDCLIKEAADAVGIGDQFYFSRLFKKYYGINPSSIKKSP